MDTSDTSATTLRLPTELKRRIKVLAAKEDKSAAEWMREALALVVKRTEDADA